MLNFSRLTSNQKERCNLNNLLKNTIELASHNYDVKNDYDFRIFKINMNLDETLPEIFASPNEIEQVILNLLKNGAQSMLDVEVEKKQFNICTSQTDEYVELIIADYGIGMSEAIKKRIFEPFFTTKNVGKGTGLGLSVSYFIIAEKHNGTIYVESEEGNGTSFTIRLPKENKQ